MVVKMTKDYLADTLDLIKSTWPKHRKRFTALEASKLVGKLGRLRKGAPWSKYMVSQLYSSIAFAFAQHKKTLSHSSKEFKMLVETIKCKNSSPNAEVNKNHESIIQHALKKAARMIHHSPIEYNIVPSMREEIAFFQKLLEPDSGVIWQAPIVHVINKTPIATAYGFFA